MTSHDALSFAYWVPNVSGGLVVSDIEQRTDHSPAYNIDTARTAEQVGYDYALTQVRYLASYGADAQQESVAFSLALLGATERLKVIAAVHPGQWPPHIHAKLAATAQSILLTGFLHVREEVERFGREVIPLVRELARDLPEQQHSQRLVAAGGGVARTVG